MRPATTSGRQTSGAAICARPCLLKSVILEADGTNAASVILYDNASAAAGTVLAKVLIPAAGSYALFSSEDGVVALNGIYADVTGTGAAYIVHYAID